MYLVVVRLLLLARVAVGSAVGAAVGVVVGDAVGDAVGDGIADATCDEPPSSATTLSWRFAFLAAFASSLSCLACAFCLAARTMTLHPWSRHFFHTRSTTE